MERRLVRQVIKKKTDTKRNPEMVSMERCSVGCRHPSAVTNG